MEARGQGLVLPGRLAALGCDRLSTVMRRLCFLLSLATIGSAQTNPFAGRWDLTVKASDATFPSWLEVTGDQVRLVGRVASVKDGLEVKRDASHLEFSSYEWFGKRVKVTWALDVHEGKIAGKAKHEDGAEDSVTGVHAPSMKREVKNWSKPVSLFDGKDLKGWEAFTTEPGKSPENHWIAQNGELVNQAPGANIRTLRKFTDFKLHIEFNCPNDGNSGIYLRGRDEVQVAYEKSNDAKHGMGSIYGFFAPSVNLPEKPGEWETFDITLVGRQVTVVRDGVTTIDNQEIPGITGGALDSNEGAPGPIYIQGDHTGGMKYRNITISTPQ